MASARSTTIPPFRVVAIAQRAETLQAQTDTRIQHLEIGQPSFAPPECAVKAAQSALSIGYTSTAGIPALRQALANLYHKRYHEHIPAEQILVTTGASSALLALFTAAFDVSDSVAVPAPGYPCYTNVLHSLGVHAVPIDTYETGYKLCVKQLHAAHEQHGLKGVIMASPSNPTGTVLTADELQHLSSFCTSINALLIVDEIYHGISPPLPTGLSHNAVVVSSFSKYFCLPGFRVGWAAIPQPELREATLRALQNMALCPPAVGQYAALAVLQGDCEHELDAHVKQYRKNLGVMVSRLAEVQFDVVEPVGAFYVWAGCERVCARLRLGNSAQLCEQLLERAFVAATPGVDFDPRRGGAFVRFCCSGQPHDVAEAADRIVRFVKEDGER